MSFERLYSCIDVMQGYGAALESLENEVEYARSDGQIDNIEEVENIGEELYELKDSLDNMSIFAPEESSMAELGPQNFRGEDRKKWVEIERAAYADMVEKDFIEHSEELEAEPMAFFNYALDELNQREEELITEYNKLLS